MNENPAAPAPPPNAGSGCCGMGCATLLGLIAFFAIAFVGGALWAVHHYKYKYTSPEPMTLTDEPTAAETAAPTAVPVPSAAVPAAPLSVKQLESQWKAFEKAGHRNEKAQIALSAAEINALLENNNNTRGRCYVAIDNNVARVRFSFPLKKVPLMKGRYLNGEATVKGSPDADPDKAEISSIVLSGESVPDSIMDQRFFGSSSMRSVISNWLNKENIQSFRIENNLVVSETRGQ